MNRTMNGASPCRSRTLLCPALVALWLLILPGPGQAQRGGPYVGLGVLGQRLNVGYEKTVDNTASNNVSLTPGRVHQSDAAETSVLYGAGYLAGYKIALRPTGIYLSAEGDMVHHSGTVKGALMGAGETSGFNQLGEVWPEDWSFSEDRSYGLTFRVGSGIPILGSGSGASVYALVGLRRARAGFRTEYTGCFTPEPCTEASEFESGADEFDENFTGWVTGAGLEKRFGIFSLRGELRHSDRGTAGRVIPFDEVGVRVPVSLNSSGLTFRADLLVYFSRN